ncbi:hypothetical protein COL516b_005615 [Colletotrichum fioriniae]|nr:uncharacterized protein COL516b_005615 [Colletotrichum fioriniae]KAJ0304839.1 hypothetical protein COL516b_005615 [Colletotrichum fioriniae]
MTKTSLFEDYVVTDRGGVIENRHGVHAAVVDASGKILYAVGNPSRMTLARSAAKPAQALAVLETPGFDRVGAKESDLRCGGHPSICPVVDRSWIRADFTPTEINNNCSGKHAGMLGGAKALGASFEHYHLPRHPIQVKVKQVVEDLSGLSGDEIKWAIDGCNLPAPGQPLYSMGRMYAAFAAAADAVEEDENAQPARVKRMSDIYNAMATYPEMVGGEGRFCTLLMEAYEGGLIGKVGADGCYTIGIRASDSTKKLGAEGAVGIAVKIEDGSLEILYAAVPEILDQLQIGTPEERRKLASFHHLKRTNTMGVVTGQVSHAFSVRRVD